jgi:hypothetical protein
MSGTSYYRNVGTIHARNLAAEFTLWSPHRWGKGAQLYAAAFQLIRFSDLPAHTRQSYPIRQF